MAMGKKTRRQDALWIVASDLPKSAGHPFYQRLNALLEANGFDRFADRVCERFYADGIGRPSMPPGRYFRLLLLGSSRGCTRSAESPGAQQILWPFGASWASGWTRRRRTTRRSLARVG